MQSITETTVTVASRVSEGVRLDSELKLKAGKKISCCPDNAVTLTKEQLIISPQYNMANGVLLVLQIFGHIW